MDRTAFSVKDANLIKTKALPNGTGSVNSDGIDLGALSGRGLRDFPCELLLEAPALSATELPDTKTMTYKIQMDDNSAFGSPTDVAASFLVQTGSTGAAGASKRWRIPTNCERYIRVVATNGGTGDASGKSLTASLVF